MPRAFVLHVWAIWPGGSSSRFMRSDRILNGQVPGRPTDAGSGQPASGMSMGMAKPWRKRVRGPGQNHVHPSSGAGALREGRFRLWRLGFHLTAVADPARPAPEPVVSITSTQSRWPLEGRDGGIRTLDSQIISLMLSPTELHLWSTRQESNPRPPDLSGALTPELHAQSRRSCDQRYTGRQSHPRQARTHELDPLPVTGKSPGSGRLGLC